MTKDFELHGDDSSDEEADLTADNAAEIEQQHSTFLASDSAFKKDDSEGYSFLAHNIAFNTFFCNRDVAAIYTSKKSLIGKNSFKNSEAELKTWITNAVTQTIQSILQLATQKVLSAKLAKQFLDTHAEMLIELVNKLLENRRLLAKQHRFVAPLPGLIKLLEALKQKIFEFIANLGADIQFETPPTFTPDNLAGNAELRKWYIQFCISGDMDFLRENGFIREKNALALKPGREKALSSLLKKRPCRTGDFYYDAMIFILKNNANYAREAENFLKNNMSRLLSGRILNDIQSSASVIQSAPGRLRNQIDYQLIQPEERLMTTALAWIPGIATLRGYIPYSVNRLKRELENKVMQYFDTTFVTQLEEQRRSLKIKLKRALPPQQHTYTSSNPTEFLANVRLSYRIQKRRKLQLEEDNEGSIPQEKSYQTAWAINQKDYLALETQTITRNGGRMDLVTNLGSYKDILSLLQTLIESVNHKISDPKVCDAAIACWVLNVLQNGILQPILLETNGQEIGTITPASIKTPEFTQLREFLFDFAYLLFGCEVQRNLGALVLHLMLLDLISKAKVSFEEMLSHPDYANSYGGGVMPMSMGSYKVEVNGEEKSKKTRVVTCARALQQRYNKFTPRKYLYDGEVADTPGGMNEVRELVSRENWVMKEWLTFFAPEAKTPKQIIAAINAKIITKLKP